MGIQWGTAATIGVGIVIGVLLAGLLGGLVGRA